MGNCQRKLRVENEYEQAVEKANDRINAAEKEILESGKDELKLEVARGRLESAKRDKALTLAEKTINDAEKDIIAAGDDKRRLEVAHGRLKRVLHEKRVGEAENRVNEAEKEIIEAGNDELKLEVARGKLERAKHDMVLVLQEAKHDKALALHEKRVNEAQTKKIAAEKKVLNSGDDQLKLQVAQRRLEQAEQDKTMADEKLCKELNYNNEDAMEARVENIRVFVEMALIAIRHGLDALNPQARNPWALENCEIPMSAATRKDPQLRTKVAKHYQCKQSGIKEGKPVTLAQCCLTQHIGDHSEVVAAHLLPRRSAAAHRESLGFKDIKHGIDNFRNIILLSKNVEAAFDRQRLCFVKTLDCNGENKFILRLLDPLVGGEVIFGGASQKICKFEGHPIQFKDPTKGPFTQMLSFHAKTSYSLARKRGWIRHENNLEHFPQEYEYGSPVSQDTIRCVMHDFASSHNSSKLSNSGSWMSPAPVGNIETKPTESSDVWTEAVAQTESRVNCFEA